MYKITTENNRLEIEQTVYAGAAEPGVVYKETVKALEEYLYNLGYETEDVEMVLEQLCYEESAIL